MTTPIQIIDEMIANLWVRDYWDQSENVLQEAKERIEALGDWWISINDRFPEEEDWYLLYSEDIWICEWWFCKSKIWENWNTKKIKDVTHWKPLPLPPNQYLYEWYNHV